MFFFSGVLFIKDLSSKQTADEGDYFCSRSKTVNYFVWLRKTNGAAYKLQMKDNAPGINMDTENISQALMKISFWEDVAKKILVMCI